MTDGLLPGADRDLVQPLARRCEKLFAAMHLTSKVTALKESGSAIEASIEGQAPQSFDRVLVAVGRRAVSDGLGLETTKGKIGERGVLPIDSRCRTAHPPIYWGRGRAGGSIPPPPGLRPRKIPTPRPPR